MTRGGESLQFPGSGASPGSRVPPGVLGQVLDLCGLSCPLTSKKTSPLASLTTWYESHMRQWLKSAQETVKLCISGGREREQEGTEARAEGRRGQHQQNQCQPRASLLPRHLASMTPTSPMVGRREQRPGESTHVSCLPKWNQNWSLAPEAKEVYVCILLSSCVFSN